MPRLLGSTSLVLMSVVLVLAACGGSAGEALTSEPPGDQAPSIIEIVAPDASRDASGDVFTFEVATTGSLVVGTRWMLGPGASPQLSAGPNPKVILANFTGEPIESTGTVKVWDAEGRSDTREFGYSVGKKRPNPVGPKVEDLPDIMLPEPETNVNVIPFTVDADDDLPDGTVTVDVEVLDGSGVTVSPARIVLQDPENEACEIEVTNTNVKRSCAVIGLYLQQSERETGEAFAGWVNGTRGIYHVPCGSEVIAIEPSTDTLRIGDTVVVRVVVYNLSNPVGYFPQIVVRYSHHLEPVPESWNIGAPGGNRWEKDGFFDQFPDEILSVDPLTLELFIRDAWGEIHVNISGLGWPITGAPAGCSGDVYNLTFKAVRAGRATIDFMEEGDFGTFYGEPDYRAGREIKFEHYENAELLVRY